jgi:hypothetical protein
MISRVWHFYCYASVVIQSVVMLNVIRLGVFRLSVVAPLEILRLPF